MRLAARHGLHFTILAITPVLQQGCVATRQTGIHHVLRKCELANSEHESAPPRDYVRKYCWLLFFIGVLQLFVLVAEYES